MPARTAAAFDADICGSDIMRRKLVPCFDALFGHALALIGDWRGPPAPRVLELGSETGGFAQLVLGVKQDACIQSLADPAETAISGTQDLILSALAIHHLEDQAKRALYRRIFDALAPGGLFVDVEQVLGATPAAEARHERIWLAEVRALGVGEAEIEYWRGRMRRDRCATVEAQLAWLGKAGFAEAECSFRAWRFAVLSGRKPAPPRPEP